MLSTKLFLFLTIATVLVFNVENCNAENMTSYDAFKISYNTLDNMAEFFEMEKDGRYALKHIYFYFKETDVQCPSQFCSSKREPDLTPKQLSRISQAGLNAPSYTIIGGESILEQLGMTSKRDPGVSSSMNYDLNLTVEENEMNLRTEYE